MDEDFYNARYININGNKIHDTAIVGDNVQMGKGNIIGPYCVIGEPGFIRENDNVKGRVIIGNENRIGSHVSIMVGQDGPTLIGDKNLIMNYVNIGHDVIIHNRNEIGAKSILCGFCKIGSGNQIKTAVAIRNRVRIRHNNIIGMRANVLDHIESEQKVYGNPARSVVQTVIDEEEDE